MAFPELPKLTIKQREDFKGRIATLRDLSIQLDGVEVKGLQMLELTIEENEIPRAELSLAVDDIDVDADVVQWLQTKVEGGDG